MSLINDVLRDLERRQRGQNDALAGLRPVQRRAGGARRLAWAMLALLLLAVLAGAGWWHLRAEQELVSQIPAKSQPAANKAKVAVTQPAVPQKSGDAAITDAADAGENAAGPNAAGEPAAVLQDDTPPARLLALEASREGEWLRLALHTERLLPHRISRGERSLELLLPGAVLDASLPDVAALDARLRTVDLRQGEQGVHLSMSFSEAVRVQAGWERVPDGARLALGIHLPPETAEAEPEAPKAVQVSEQDQTTTSVAATDNGADSETDSATPADREPAPTAARFSKQASAPTPERRARDYLREGDEKLADGRPRAALEAYRAALDWQPELEAARRGLVDALQDLGREDEAMDELRVALARADLSTGGAADFAARLARLLAATGDTAQAVSVLEAHAPARLGDGEYHALLAALHQRAGNFAESARWYQRVLEVDPQRAVWWMGLGLALEGAGSFEAATRAYGAALQAGGLGPEAEQFVRERLRALQ